MINKYINTIKLLAVNRKRYCRKTSKGSFLILGAVVILAIIGILVIVIGIGLFSDLTGNNSGGPNPLASSNTPISPVNGSCPNVTTIDQLTAGWCGRASQAQVISFWKGNYAYYASRGFLQSHGLAVGTLNSLSGKSYHFSNSAQEVVNSVNNGRPVIAYTTVYKTSKSSGNHIIVLTCYNNETQTFTANNSEPRGRGGQQSVQRIGRVDLTVSNLTGPYSGADYYGHPNFLISDS